MKWRYPETVFVDPVIGSIVDDPRDEIALVKTFRVLLSGNSALSPLKSTKQVDPEERAKHDYKTEKKADRERRRTIRGRCNTCKP